MKRHVPHALYPLGARGRLAARPAGISLQPLGAARDITIAPAIAVRLVSPVARAIAVTSPPCAHISTIRARQTHFWGELRFATQPSNVARSSGDSWMLESIDMLSDSHVREPMGIPPLGTKH